MTIVTIIFAFDCFQRDRNKLSHKHTKKILWTPKLTNVSILPKPPTNQPVTRQTAQAPGKENMLFFWASLNFPAYKTQPHGAHPTHGAITAPVSHLKPIVTSRRPRKLRSGPAACIQGPRGLTHRHSHTNKLFLRVPSYRQHPKKALEGRGSEIGHSLRNHIPRALSTWPTAQNKRLYSVFVPDGRLSVCLSSEAWEPRG